jgi:hypothetical protein
MRSPSQGCWHGSLRSGQSTEAARRGAEIRGSYEEAIAVHAKIGDRLVEEGKHVGNHQRVGVITALRRDDGTPPYMVRWLDNGHEALVFPGSDARVEEARPMEESG